MSTLTGSWMRQVLGSNLSSNAIPPNPSIGLLKAYLAQAFIGIWIGLLISTQAHAQLTVQINDSVAISCNISFSQSVFQDMSKLEAKVEEALLSHLQSQLPVCQSNVPWLVWAGQTLMKAKQFLLASDYLERALMLEPDNKGAKLDYALSLAGSEQPDAALSLVQGLLKEPDMPAYLRGTIQTLLARLEAPQRSRPGFSMAALANQGNEPNNAPHKFYAGLKVGRDSNLLGAPNLSELSLNFSGTPFSLSLDSSYLSQSGNYSRADVGWSYTQPASENFGALQAWAQARGRESSTAPEARQHQTVVGIEYRAKPFAMGMLGTKEALSLGAWRLDQVVTYLSAQDVQLRGGTSLKYSAQTLGLGLQKSFGIFEAQCDTKLGAEGQNRNLVSNPILSGRYEGITVQWFCQSKGSAAWLLAASRGQDRNTDPARAGGPQAETALRAMAKKGPLLVELEADYKKDSSIYSLLLSNSVRKIARVGSRIEWQGSISPSSFLIAQLPELQMQAGVQWSYQKSNLQLFRQQNWGPYVGLSRAW